MPVHYDVDGHVATVTIEGYNAHNPMTAHLEAEVCRGLQRGDEDPQVRAIILRGAGEKHFSAGGDLKAFHNKSKGMNVEERLTAFWYPSEQLNGRSIVFRQRVEKPVIGAVIGYCLGAGLMILGMQSSIRIAGESAKFGLAEVKRGLGGSGATKSDFLNQVPYTTLMMMLCTGRLVDARSALKVGFINEVVPDSEVMARARQVADVIARNDPIAIRAAKQALIRTEHAPVQQSAATAGVVATLQWLQPR